MNISETFQSFLASLWNKRHHTMATDSATGGKRKTSEPPAGYVCSLCNVEGHWIQQCPQRAKKKKQKRDHVPVEGIDPSTSDIEEARAMQAIKPPKCFCGEPSRLSKVKKSKVKEDSRANGNYFFFCAKKKQDHTMCKFARPAQDELTPKSTRPCPFFLKKGKCKKGDKCIFSHDLTPVAVPTES
jgi:Zinc knuckle/Zinc finger domain